MSSSWSNMDRDLNGDDVGKHGDDETLVFPDSVQAVIGQVFPSSDPLDKPDFCAVDYINELFPTEQSLNNLDDVVSDMKCKIQCIDDDMRKIVRSQTTIEQEATKSLEHAQTSIVELFKQIRDIKAKAAESEAMVQDITRDIKQLDVAKRNLTAAITTLNHLYMLVGGVSTLRRQTLERQYGDASMLLQGLLQVLQHFEHYVNIPQIKDLSSQLKQIQDQLGAQINHDFQVAFSAENAKMFSCNRQLAEACLVVSVLDSSLNVKSNLIKFVLKRQMAEYAIIFADTEDGSWLDKVDNRFNWLKRNLMDFEDHIGPVFPPDWEMSERIAVEFCDLTRRSLERLMFKRKLDMDTKLLLHAIQRTTNFESLLSRRFSGVTLEQYQLAQKEAEKRQAEDDKNNPFLEDEGDTKNPFLDGDDGDSAMAAAKGGPHPSTESSQMPFRGIISHCFEPYLNIYIDSQNQSLVELIERAAAEQKSRGHANLSVEGSSVLHSCGDLFLFYKKCMVQLSQLTSGEPMVALTGVFKRHLKDYANKILLAHFPKASSSSGGLTMSASAASLSSMTTNFTKDFSTQNFIQNVQSLLKEGDAAAATVKLSNDERVFLCSAIVTSEYIIETTQQLEAKLKEKVSPAVVDKISLAAEQDVFHSVVTASIGMLVQDLECACDPSLTAMVKTPWSHVDSVGDQSIYVTSVVTHMKQTVPFIRDNLASSKKYFTQFCIRFANSFIPKFLNHLYKCRPISTVGAEQLLLDTHSLKTLLIDLPTLGSKFAPMSAAGAAHKKAPASYTKIVVKGMTRAEMILKVVMSPAEPVKSFVEHYTKLLGAEADSSELIKVLDMKGVRKVDHAQYVEQLNQSRPSASTQPDACGPDEACQKPQLQQRSQLESAAKKAADESRIKKLERLIKKRL